MSDNYRHPKWDTPEMTDWDNAPEQERAIGCRPSWSPCRPA